MIYRWTTDFSRDKQAVLRPEQPKKRHPVTVIRLQNLPDRVSAKAGYIQICSTDAL